ncbi:30S ribosomal protein S7 [Candidatus Falkowbacteria bacterium]|jgi:small subunit ribosomal protein S7|nr:30S ribosomal protein S7 [Candidatus Falkowbacteria bacterium]MBT5502982.1 30S ribosomal protein S7 [Candidatus Falkowbacteria bacterium]MBT6574338.1 30S ribosomal protein S7 [Candidatus Falkowbacteria bacterium]MBT7349069.1 30S ribosomal protein S7 [Candidatus Falkowbacteria bacterium]MBT7500937.1 30S ribosomal protein S7 [Candidatus Falkowbacteria bacterium]
MRGKQAPKRKIKTDIRYNSALVSKFINYLMEDGKRAVSQKIVYDCFEIIQKQIDTGKIKKEEFPTALSVFDQAVKNVTPQMEVRGRRIGGGNYQIPYPVRGERKQFLSLHWLITAAKKKKGKPMHIKLSDELVAAMNSEGDAFKKKTDVHRMADSNRAFAHFARY